MWGCPEASQCVGLEWKERERRAVMQAEGEGERSDGKVKRDCVCFLWGRERALACLCIRFEGGRGGEFKRENVKCPGGRRTRRGKRRRGDEDEDEDEEEGCKEKRGEVQETRRKQCEKRKECEKKKSCFCTCRGLDSFIHKVTRHTFYVRFARADCVIRRGDRTDVCTSFFFISVIRVRKRQAAVTQAMAERTWMSW